MSGATEGLLLIWKKLSYLRLVVIFAQLSYQQKDPVYDFCRRFGQQTAIIDDKLFIDGGLVDWNPIPQNPANYTNTWLLYNDLSQTNEANFPPLYANLSKNGTIPNVSGGILWADDVNKRFYLFGGDYYQSPPDVYSLYSYDALNNYWTSLGEPSTSITSVSWGAGVSISEQGLGFYYGGWLSNASEAGYSGSPLATTGLVKYDMDSNVWSNSSGPDGVPRAEGVMTYIPASDSGMLIYFGGITTPYNNETLEAFNLTKILVYDIAGSKWYEQEATGDIPENRRRFCGGATWAKDYSSYNIYIYGGASFPPATAGFDDVYILTLPAFRWIKWYPASTGSDIGLGSPHHSLTCNVINGAQMMVIGGTFPLTTDCDNPNTFGSHNLDLGKNNSDDAMWYQYRPNLTNYNVPTEVIAVVGGGPAGGATVTAPLSGFSDPDLSVYFTRTATFAARTPTRDVSGSSNKDGGLSTGAIVGIAIGGAVVLFLIVFGGFCCLRRRRRLHEDQAAESWARPVAAPQSNEDYSPMYASSNQRSLHSPYSAHTTPTTPSHAQPYPAQANPIAELSGSPVMGSDIQSVPPVPVDDSTKWEPWPPYRPTAPVPRNFVELQPHRSGLERSGTELDSEPIDLVTTPVSVHAHSRSYSNRSVPRSPAPDYEEQSFSRRGHI